MSKRARRLASDSESDGGTQGANSSISVKHRKVGEETKVIPTVSSASAAAAAARSATGSIGSDEEEEQIYYPGQPPEFKDLYTLGDGHDDSEALLPPTEAESVLLDPTSPTGYSINKDPPKAWESRIASHKNGLNVWNKQMTALQDTLRYPYSMEIVTMQHAAQIIENPKVKDPSIKEMVAFYLVSAIRNLVYCYLVRSPIARSNENSKTILKEVMENGLWVDFVKNASTMKCVFTNPHQEAKEVAQFTLFRNVKRIASRMEREGKKAPGKAPRSSHSFYATKYAGKPLQALCVIFSIQEHIKKDFDRTSKEDAEAQKRGIRYATKEKLNQRLLHSVVRFNSCVELALLFFKRAQWRTKATK